MAIIILVGVYPAVLTDVINAGVAPLVSHAVAAQAPGGLANVGGFWRLP